MRFCYCVKVNMHMTLAANLATDRGQKQEARLHHYSRLCARQASCLEVSGGRQAQHRVLATLVRHAGTAVPGQMQQWVTASEHFLGLPHDAADLLLEALPVLPPLLGCVNVGWRLVVWRRQHGDDGQHDRLHLHACGSVKIAAPLTRQWSDSHSAAWLWPSSFGDTAPSLASSKNIIARRK